MSAHADVTAPAHARAGVLTTARLRLRRLDHADAPFVLRLVNEPSWLEFIGDKGVRSLDDARRYLDAGPLTMYRERGFGLYAVERLDGGEPLGMCGLIKRDTLPHVDIGYAFLPEHWGRGYAREAAAACVEHARRDFSLPRLLAILSPHNARSIRLLEQLGFGYEGALANPDNRPTSLYALAL